MSANSSSKQRPASKDGADRWRFQRVQKAIVFCILVMFGFGAAQALVIAAVYVMRSFGVSFSGIDDNVLTSVVSAAVYALTLAIVIGLPWIIRKYRTTKQEIGLSRLLSWMDIALAPAGFILYFLGSAIATYAISQFVPSIDLTQVQETGFGHIEHYYEYILAFVTLIILAPVAEEILFRGYLYGKLRKLLPVWATVLITSLLFAFAHGQWNVGIDVFILSIVLCSLREVTGSIWAGMLLHMMKNGLAFYLLFINPSLLHTIGG